MFRLSGFICIALAVICGTLLFWTSQSVQRAEYELAQTTQKDAGEQESLRVLSAEWDYLNRPERLEQLTVNNLDMDESHVEGDNFIEAASDIPQPIVPIIPKIKPAFVQNVSMEAPVIEAPVQVEESTIQNSERQSFDALIESFETEGAE